MDQRSAPILPHRFVATSLPFQHARREPCFQLSLRHAALLTKLPVARARQRRLKQTVSKHRLSLHVHSSEAAFRQSVSMRRT